MINPDVVIKEVEQHFYLADGSLKGPRRRTQITSARAVAMYILRSINNWSYHEIGEWFNKDHTAAMHNCKKIVTLLHYDRQHPVCCATSKLIEQLQEKYMVEKICSPNCTHHEGN